MGRSWLDLNGVSANVADPISFSSFWRLHVSENVFLNCHNDKTGKSNERSEISKKSQNRRDRLERVHPRDLERVGQLQEQIDTAASDAERNKLQMRLGTLLRQLETKPLGRPRLFPLEQEAEFFAQLIMV